MPHGWHKSAVEMYLPVLQEREAAKVMPMGQPLLQCRPSPSQAQHHSEYVAGHNHHHGVPDPDNSGTPPGSGQPPVTLQDV
ncbi:hypothetical protein MTR_4g032150 [Medicago truncatula]|uniref:Uncharacterized protein n=1 Tax=Medicago truncatula TaxID=3880 RepID=G7JN44_MEDTR|nr:hypothetical protein MTR_4g032150 [Medicago truncatula]